MSAGRRGEREMRILGGDRGEGFAGGGGIAESFFRCLPDNP